jgi:predicted ATPase
VGRETELADLDRLLSDPGVHLVTILGAGGMGKTRLALEAARAQLDRYEDGVFLVALAPLRSAEAMVPAVAGAVGLTFHHGGEPRQQLLGFLQRKRMLLAFDNFEHVLAGVDLVSDILRSAPEVKVLATSRARLNLQEEQRYHLRGMDAPDALPPATVDSPEAALEYSAVRLFVQSARRADPGFALEAENLQAVVRICRTVGGMPLGILLAAAWVEMLTPAEIADEVERNLDFLESEARDLPERQRSMRAVYNHSWDLLAPGERGVLRALSVFRGGFTRQTAQEVTGASLRDLRTLVNRSLLHRAPAGRFEMHELLRQYAREKLTLSPDEEERVRDRHAAYYAATLSTWPAQLKGERPSSAEREMDLEIDNARAAWDWALERGRLDLLREAIEGLCLFLCRRFHCQDREAILRLAAEKLAAPIAVTESEKPTPRPVGAGPSRESTRQGPAPGLEAPRLVLLVRVLSYQAYCSFFEPSSQALRRAQKLLDQPELAEFDVRRERAGILALLARDAQEVDRRQAKQLYERSLALYRDLGARSEMATVMHGLGLVARYLGTYVEAQQWAEQSLAIRRTLRDQADIGRSLVLLSAIAVRQGRLEDSEHLIREAWAIFARVWPGHPAGEGLGWVLCARGRFDEGLRELEENRTVREERGAPSIGHSWLSLANVHLGRYGQARRHGELAVAASRAGGIPREIGFALLVQSWPALAEGAYAKARELLDESVAVYRGVEQVDWASWTLACAGYAERALGRQELAWEHAREALQTGVELHAFFPLIYGLPLVALLLADKSACSTLGVERAVEVYALASRYGHVANSRWFEDVAGKRIAAAAATLPPEVVAAAQARGRARDLWATAEELLTQL